jgi:class 3 adenylate cyclase
LALVLPALVVALLSVLEGVAWIGRPFPGFLLMRNAVVPTIAAYHWTGMQAELPFHSTVLAVDGTPLAHSNDVDTHAASVPDGTPVTYTLFKDGETFERRVATMTFRGYDYALTLGLFAFNGLVILVMGAIVGLLSPQNRQARVFLLASVLMGVYALSSTDLYRAHRFWELHWMLQCITPAALIHLALVFPVERVTGASGRALVAVPYLGGAVLGIVLLRGMAATPVDLRPFYASFVFTVVALLTLVVGSLLAYVQYRRAVVRGRVQIVLVGVVAAFLLPAFGYFNNIFGGGDLPLNLSGAVTPTLFILAVAYAIARHKLFDVQLIVRRSVVFACLLAAFTTLYVAAVSALDLVLTGGDLRSSPAFTGAFMGVSLALAFPLRDRLSAIIAARLFPHKHRVHQTIREISQAIASMVDLDAILAKVLAALETDMGLATGAVLLRREAGGTFFGVTSFGMSVTETTVAGDGPLARLLETTRTEVFLDDVEEDTALTGVKEACLPVFAALEAELLLPLFSDTGMVGVLALGRTRGGDPLTSEDVELLRSLAAGIGLAVARSLDATRAERMALHRQVLERHLPATSVRNVVGQEAAGPGARRVRVTALCVRLGGFPAFAERAEPERAVEILKGYYALCDRLLRQYAGTAERYEGELATVIFGAPVATTDHALRAARVALALRRELEEKRAAWREHEYELAVTCGLATGVAYVGLIATGSQGTYAGLGRTMDIAEELSMLAEPGVILAQAETASGLPAEVVTTAAGALPLVAAPTPIDAVRVEEERAPT